MLNRIDLIRLFDVAKKEGFRTCEIYAEALHHCAVHLRGKWLETRLTTSIGISLRCSTETAVHTFTTTELNTDTLLALVRGEAPQAARLKKTIDLPSVFEKLDDKVASLSQTARQLWAEVPEAQFPTLKFEGEIKLYEVAREPLAEISGGREESAVVTADWVLEHDGKRTTHNAEVCRTSVERLFQDLKGATLLATEMKRSLAKSAPWPVPRGKMPVLWSSRAVSQLCLPFLRAFEGDSVLRERSFLSHLKLPLDLGFYVEETPPVAFDNEGSPTRNLILFDGARPKGLFVNNRVASELSVPSTGHCRRTSFQSLPTVLFWNPQIRGRNEIDEPLAQLQWGLSVQDVEIVEFDPVTTDTRLKLRHATLIHHGEEGERVEPIEFEVNLLDLMASWRWFSKAPETTGVQIAKQQQRFVSEISAPSALSESMPIPGQVPLQHYW